MIFTTLEFLIFFCIVFFVYYVVPKKLQWVVLLIASIYFYLCASINYIIFVILATFITYIGALKINELENNQNTFLNQHKNVLSKEHKKLHKLRTQKRKKKIVTLSVIGTLSMLVIMKYTSFIIENISGILNVFNIRFNGPEAHFILPLGISFYTFMSLGYVIDIYRGEYEPEKNFFKYFLYISYFPHILQGPMDKYNELSKELFIGKSFNYEEAIKGTYRITVGVLKKMVVADKLATVITAVTSNIEEYYGINILLTIILYAIQLYADFSGYMDIAIGCSEMLGIRIAENFDAPYFSKSIAEYWRRWHISLGAWFRDYVYYPVLRGKKAEKIRKYFKDRKSKFLANNLPTVFALAVIWILIGFWHGSTWAFILYGMYHGSIIIISTLFTPIYNKFYKIFPKLIKSKLYRAFQIIRTFSLVLVGYFLFSIGELHSALHMFSNMFITDLNSKSLAVLISRDCKISIIIGVILLFILDICKINKIDVYRELRALPFLLRWSIYALGMFIIIMFSTGTAQEFLYFQF